MKIIHWTYNHEVTTESTDTHS